MFTFNHTTNAAATAPGIETSAQSAFGRRGMNATHRRALTALAAVLALSFGFTSQADAANLKCKADVFVKNEKVIAIKVLRFGYKVRGDNDWHWEPLLNKRLAPGETEEWRTQKLGHAAEGNLITTTRLEFKDDNSGAGDGWGPVRLSDEHAHSDSYLCFDGTNYWIGVD